MAKGHRVLVLDGVDWSLKWLNLHDVIQERPLISTLGYFVLSSDLLSAYIVVEVPSYPLTSYQSV